MSYKPPQKSPNTRHPTLSATPIDPFDPWNPLNPDEPSVSVARTTGVQLALIYPNAHAP
jgi:hypothetical protein